ncbi:hypothetical protein [Weissella confusa]|nr:hypothetical protein [Weissella confusa]
MRKADWFNKSITAIVWVAFGVPIVMMLAAPFWKVALWAWGFIPW